MLRMSFSHLYYKESITTFIILSGGLNDLDKTTDHTINELMLFKRNILQQNPQKTFFVLKLQSIASSPERVRLPQLMWGTGLATMLTSWRW